MNVWILSVRELTRLLRCYLHNWKYATITTGSHQSPCASASYPKTRQQDQRSAYSFCRVLPAIPFSDFPTMPESPTSHPDYIVSWPSVPGERHLLRQCPRSFHLRERDHRQTSPLSHKASHIQHTTPLPFFQTTDRQDRAQEDVEASSTVPVK